ncbi:MAG: rRNA cytosine-C5-methyltransferase [Frankiales bacterium]|nr:rRNA cytosine-C5-methyltransferase [Frankiales bacterium]
MTPSQRSARAPVDLARRTAYDVVLAVDVDDAFANLVLPRVLRERNVATQDAGFATELSYGTLRWQGCLDTVLQQGSKRPIDALDPPVRAALRLGAYQLLHMRVPAHASVHATVELLRSVAGERAVGFANAVLRRVAEKSWQEWVDVLAPRDEPGRSAFAAGYPGWIADAWLAALDGDLAELRAAMAEDRPATHLVARPGRISRDQLLEQAGPGAAAGPWSPYAVRLAGGDPASVPAVRDGRAGVQDEGSQLAALALAQTPVNSRDERWLDLCAGPGGKSALLDGLRPPDGILVSADLQAHRARLVSRGRLTAAAAAPPVLVVDGRAPAWRPQTFDRVLVDAPCTGLGALRRRPEVRWRRRPEDVPRLQSLQQELLRSAVASCRPGGVVAYVTCSPHPAETTEVVNAVRDSQAGVDLVDVRQVLVDVPDVGTRPDVQLWPHRHGTDAMYVAILRIPGTDH